MPICLNIWDIILFSLVFLKLSSWEWVNFFSVTNSLKMPVPQSNRVRPSAFQKTINNPKNKRDSTLWTWAGTDMFRKEGARLPSPAHLIPLSSSLPLLGEHASHMGLQLFHWKRINNIDLSGQFEALRINLLAFIMNLRRCAMKTGSNPFTLWESIGKDLGLWCLVSIGNDLVFK